MITVGNQKGGVGKSTHSVHLAAALGKRGRRCLLIDLDPAAGSTKHLGVPVNSFAGTLELLTTDETIESLAVVEGMPDNVALIPARPQLSEIESLLSKYVDRTCILDRALDAARARFDVVILDTGPSAAFCTTVAAYSSSDWFLLSAFAHPLSLGGLTEALADIADVRRARNGSLEVLGVVFTAVDRRATRLRGQLEEVVARALPGRRFETAIPQAIVIPEASGRGRTLFQMPRWELIPSAIEYLRLAAEVEHRINNREDFLRGTLEPPDLDAEVASTLGHAVTPSLVVNG
ncbi:MAG: ParA family protein [Phycisphaerae bacterium]|nr:ParA family protein [Phycisphaerae bacterium]